MYDRSFSDEMRLKTIVNDTSKLYLSNTHSNITLPKAYISLHAIRTHLLVAITLQMPNC